MGPFLQVGGQWEIIQSNNATVKLNINQVGDEFSAVASHHDGRVRSIDANGFVRNHNFQMTITWDDGTKGLYAGELTSTSEGTLRGSAVDLNHLESIASWKSNGKVFGFA